MADILDGNYHIISALSIDNVKTPGIYDTWRLYNPNSGEHFYTRDYREYAYLISIHWNGEGLAFQSTASASVPVYRLYNENSGLHMFTQNKGEKDSLVNAGWKSEGVGFKVDGNGNVPIYRLYNDQNGDHLFTASAYERDVVKGWEHWVYEGIAWYGSSIFALDTAADIMADGTKIQLGQYCRTKSQVWNLSTRSNKTRQITNRLGWKTLDSAGQTAGCTAHAWADVDNANQTWIVTDSGSTATVDGVECPLCYIRLRNGLSLTANSGDIGAQTTVKAYSAGSRSQLWAFLTVPEFENGQVYEIVSMRDSSRQLTITGNVRNGAPAKCLPHNGSNNQKFMALRYYDGVALYSLSQGKSLDLVGGPSSYANDGTGVNAWDSYDGKGQRWLVTEAGEARIFGKLASVYTFGAGNTGACNMEAHNVHQGSDEVSIRKASDELQQRWALVPTHSTDANIPAPYELGISYSLNEKLSRQYIISGDNPAYNEDGTIAEGIDQAFFTWRMPTTNKLFKGTTHCEIRIRRRTAYTYTTSWTDWGGWTAWRPVYLKINGDRAYDSVHCLFTNDPNVRAIEMAFAVRCVATLDNGTITARGPEVSQHIMWFKKPTVAFSLAGWAPDGLHISYESDWTVGDTYVTFKNITTKWGNTIRSKSPNLRLRGDESSSLLIPNGQVWWPSNNTDASFTYNVGTELMPNMGKTESATVKVTYDTGSGQSVAPTLSKGNIPATILASVPHLGTDRLWINVAGVNTEITNKYRSGDKTVFVIAPPFGKDFDLWVSCTSADKDKWGTDYTHLTANDAAALGVRPMHLFLWGTNGVAVEYRAKEPLETERTVTAEYEARKLDSRDHESVSFAPTLKSKWSVKGAFTDALNTEDGMEAMEKLIRARHVNYTSPTGEMCKVAVVGYSIDRHHDYDEVTIDLIEETR